MIMMDMMILDMIIMDMIRTIMGFLGDTINY